MAKKGLQELFLYLLRDIYDAENKAREMIPKLIKEASSSKLKSMLEQYLNQSQQHRQKLENLFKDLKEDSEGVLCRGMGGLIDECKDLLDNFEGEALDAALIAQIQSIVHYKIAGYGTMRTYAKLLGNNTSANVLQGILSENEEDDKKFTSLAEMDINRLALTR